MDKTVINEIAIFFIETHQILTLEDKIYVLSKIELPNYLQEKLKQAVSLFEEYNEEEASSLIEEIKERCNHLGINVELPKNSSKFVWH